MIPKILHFIWLGPLPMPNTISTWYEEHREWKINIWTDDNIKDLELINHDIFKQAGRKYNKKSDILRLELLYKFGGVYVDADILNLCSITPLISDSHFFISQEKRGLLSNSVIGSVAKNPIIMDLILNIKETYDPEIAVWKSTGPRKITNFFTECNLIEEINNGFEFKSNMEGLSIFSYACFNFMANAMIGHKKHVLYYDLSTITQRLLKNNYDVRYIKNNRHRIEEVKNNIYGIQLWMGGKPKLYKRPLNIEHIKKNIHTYIEFICKINPIRKC